MSDFIDWTQLEPGDRENLAHMLGRELHRPARDWGYRNYFAPGGGKSIASMERLEKHGLVVRGRKYHHSNYFHATLSGCLAAGFLEEKARQICARKPQAGGEGKG